MEHTLTIVVQTDKRPDFNKVLEKLDTEIQNIFEPVQISNWEVTEITKGEQK